MRSRTVVDAEGRIYIPTKIRRLLNLTDWVKLKVEGDQLILTKSRSPIEEGYGIFKRKKRVTKKC